MGRCANYPLQSVYKVEWNEEVHTSMLGILNGKQPWLVIRNLKSAETDCSFVGNLSSRLSDFRINYGIFLTPPERVYIQQRIRDFITDNTCTGFVMRIYFKLIIIVLYTPRNASRSFFSLYFFFPQPT